MVHNHHVRVELEAEDGQDEAEYDQNIDPYHHHRGTVPRQVPVLSDLNRIARAHRQKVDLRRSVESLTGQSATHFILTIAVKYLVEIEEQVAPLLAKAIGVESLLQEAISPLVLHHTVRASVDRSDGHVEAEAYGGIVFVGKSEVNDVAHGLELVLAVNRHIGSHVSSVGDYSRRSYDFRGRAEIASSRRGDQSLNSDSMIVVSGATHVVDEEGGETQEEEEEEQAAEVLQCLQVEVDAQAELFGVALPPVLLGGHASSAGAAHLQLGDSSRAVDFSGFPMVDFVDHLSIAQALSQVRVFMSVNGPLLKVFFALDHFNDFVNQGLRSQSLLEHDARSARVLLRFLLHDADRSEGAPGDELDPSSVEELAFGRHLSFK
mmetsp:Transcript_27946/g.42243  ORF Transcript_27946/g.42243 Transcript_27946/m.42243 type:complete len:377 (-) Transcript_27946:578-1708(-)